MADAPAMAPGQMQAQQLRAAGFGDSEIASWAQEKRQTLNSAGFGEPEINAWFGQPDYDFSAMKSQVESNLASSPKPVTDFKGALEAGWQQSVTGLVSRQKAPEVALSPEAPMTSRLAAMAGGITGDVPAMVAGFMLGTPAGIETGPGAPIVGTATAFALPQLLRSTLMDAYSKGSFKSFSDFWPRAAGILADTAKAYVTGGATAGAGIATKAALPMVSAGVSKVAQTAAEAATMTTVGKALEGQVPTAQDFVDSAVAVGGLHFAGVGAAKLRGLYAETGIKPSEVVADAQHDVTISQDLASVKTPVPSSYVNAEAAKQPPIVQFRNDFAEIEKALPPVEDGMTRLWRGNRPGEEGQNPSFTSDAPGIALPFQKAYGGKLTYVDVPTDWVTSQPKRGGATDAEYIVPQGVAAKAQAAPSPYEKQTEAGAAGGGIPPEQPPETPPPAPSDDPQKRILSHLSIGETSTGRPWTFSRLYSAAVDRLFPLGQAVKEATGGEELPASEDPYKLARLMAGAAGKADAMLTGQGTYDFNTYQNNGASLEAILDPIKDDLDGLRAFASSHRALELEARGIKTGFDLNAAQAVVDQGGDKYEQHLQNLIGFQNRVAAYLRDSGVLSQDGYNAMLDANKFYVPFQRLIEPEPGLRISGASLQAKNPIHAIEGSARTVIDPIESIIRNTYLFTQMAERNAVGTKLVDLLSGAKEAAESDTPEASDATKSSLNESGVSDPDALAPMVEAESNPPRPGEIRIYRDGKPETYRIDPELAIAMKGLDQQSMGMIEKALAPMSRSLRAGAVLQPDFIARHTLRDFLYAFVTTGEGIFTPMDMVRGIVGLARKDEDFENWRKAGGANISMVSLDRRYLQTSIDDLAGTGLLERAWNVVGNPESGIGEKAKAVATLPIKAVQKFLISPLQVGVQFAESASHLGAFKKAMRAEVPEGAEPTKEQIQQAGFVSRDTAVDASRMGSAMRPWNAISAFANITVQDTDRVMRAFINSPMGTAIKIAGAISLPSALVWMNGMNDSRYKDAPDWERDLFWVIPTDRWEDADPNNAQDLPTDLVRTTADGRTQINNGITWRIPKPWGMGIVFGSGVERTLDAFAAGDPSAFSGLASSMSQVSIPNLLPNAITPSIEQFANRSIFTNRTLIPSPQEGYLPEYQYTEYTSELAKALGGVIGAFPGISDEKMKPGMFGGIARALSSPILIENYVREWSGNLGMYALQAADAGLRKAGITPDPPKPDDTLADIPFVRAFVVRYPEASSQPMQDFYDAYDRNNIYYNTWIGLAKAGDFDAAARVAQAGGEPMMMRLTGMRNVIAEQAKLVRDIYKNPDIPSDEKRQLIDTTYWRMTELAKAGNELLRNIPAAQSQSATVH